MKLKLADYVISRAKQLLQPEAKEYDQAGALIRRRARHAAERCAKIGRNTDVQYHGSLKEFLAFLCVVTVNELALRVRPQAEPELRTIYQKVVKAVAEGTEPDKSRMDHQLAVRRIMTYKRSGFDHWFFGYWNADFEGMRVSPADLRDVEKKHIPGASGDYSADSRLILLVRISRLENAQSSLPPAAALREYDRVIGEEVKSFVDSLREVLP